MTDEIYLLTAKLVIVMPEQELAKTPATTINTADKAEAADQSAKLTPDPTAHLTAECSVTITLDSDTSQLQANLCLYYDVIIAWVRSGPVPTNSKKLHSQTTRK